MSVPSRPSLDLARSVIELEAGGATDAAGWAEAADRALTRLREHLSRLVGSAGFTALARRALGLACAEHAFLRGVSVSPRASDGLVGLSEVFSERDPATARMALEAILAHVIDLLFRFLGARMTIRLIRNAWPELEAPGGPERPAENP